MYLDDLLLLTSPSYFTYKFNGNLRTWFPRLVGPLYADGMTAPRISVTGTQLPLPRIVSRTVHPDEGFHDHAGTVMVVAWGQFMDHDYTLTATPLGQYRQPFSPETFITQFFAPGSLLRSSASVNITLLLCNTEVYWRVHKTAPYSDSYGSSPNSHPIF